MRSERAAGADIATPPSRGGILYGQAVPAFLARFGARLATNGGGPWRIGNKVVVAGHAQVRKCGKQQQSSGIDREQQAERFLIWIVVTARLGLSATLVLALGRPSGNHIAFFGSATLPACAALASPATAPTSGP